MERSLRNIVTPQLTHASRTLEVSRIWDPPFVVVAAGLAVRIVRELWARVVKRGLN